MQAPIGACIFQGEVTMVNNDLVVGVYVFLKKISFTPQNRKIYKQWFSNSYNIKQMGYIGDVLNDNDIDRWKKQIEVNKQIMFNIFLCASSEMIGLCSISTENKGSDEGEIEILIGKECNRNKGYGTETINLLIEFCRSRLHLKKLKLRVLNENTRAIKSYINAGFIIYNDTASNNIIHMIRLL